MAPARDGRTRPHAIRLVVRPLLSGRDYHATHHENGALHGESRVAGTLVTWHPYVDLPVIVSRANAAYAHRPAWYRQFLYSAERDRGLDDREDLWSPGELTFALGDGDAVWLLAPARSGAIAAAEADVVAATAARLETERARRAAFPSPLARAADAYLVARGARPARSSPAIRGSPTGAATRSSPCAGCAWRPAACDVARSILLEWSGVVSEGMLPNRFPDGGERPGSTTPSTPRCGSWSRPAS